MFQIVSVFLINNLNQTPPVNCPSQQTEETTRLVENAVLTTKGLQERNTQLLDGMTVEK